MPSRTTSGRRRRPHWRSASHTGTRSRTTNPFSLRSGLQHAAEELGALAHSRPDRSRRRLLASSPGAGRPSPVPPVHIVRPCTELDPHVAPGACLRAFVSASWATLRTPATASAGRAFACARDGDLGRSSVGDGRLGAGSPLDAAASRRGARTSAWRVSSRPCGPCRGPRPTRSRIRSGLFRLPLDQQPGGLQVDELGGQAVGEDVVDLPRDPRAFRECRRGRPRPRARPAPVRAAGTPHRGPPVQPERIAAEEDRGHGDARPRAVRPAHHREGADHQHPGGQAVRERQPLHRQDGRRDPGDGGGHLGALRVRPPAHPVRRRGSMPREGSSRCLRVVSWKARKAPAQSSSPTAGRTVSRPLKAPRGVRAAPAPTWPVRPARSRRGLRGCAASPISGISDSRVGHAVPLLLSTFMPLLRRLDATEEGRRPESAQGWSRRLHPLGGRTWIRRRCGTGPAWRRNW